MGAFCKAALEVGSRLAMTAVNGGRVSESVRSQDIQAVVRATDVLRLASQRGEITVREVSAELALDRTTAHRYLSTLLNVGFLVRDRSGRDSGYRLGPFASVLSGSESVTSSPLAAARGALDDIAVEVSATVVIGVVHAGRVVVTDVAYAPEQVLSVRPTVGYHVPLAGIQSIVALAHSSADVVESVLEHGTAAERAVVRERIDAALEGGGLVDRGVDGVPVVAVPLLHGGRVVATIAALALPGDASWGERTLSLMTRRAEALSRA